MLRISELVFGPSFLRVVGNSFWRLIKGWLTPRTLLGADFALLSDTPFVCVSTDVGSSLDSLRDFVRPGPLLAVYCFFRCAPVQLFLSLGYKISPIFAEKQAIQKPHCGILARSNASCADASGRGAVSCSQTYGLGGGGRVMLWPGWQGAPSRGDGGGQGCSIIPPGLLSYETELIMTMICTPLSRSRLPHL